MPKTAPPPRPPRRGNQLQPTKATEGDRQPRPPSKVTSPPIGTVLPWAVLPAIIFLLYSFATPDDHSKVSHIMSASNDEELETWQACDVFMAPTNISGTGWGVFAARDFEQNELFNILPLFVPMEINDEQLYSEHRLVKSTQLDDYVYGVYRPHIQKQQQMVLFGYEMVYNHHPTAQNVQFGLGNGYSQGFYAKKSARAGEQLFSSYGATDRGADWFDKRGLTMRLETDRISSREQLEFLSSKYCSKIYAGPGRNTYASLIPSIHPDRVAPFDAGLFDARAKVTIQPGDVIEQGPAILLPKRFIQDTALAPLGI